MTAAATRRSAHARGVSSEAGEDIRGRAEVLTKACDRHPLQARVIRKQAALRRGHLPLRRLLDQASDVLFAIKPCWAMSPLMVSQVLPPTRLFDVVIFDEASQIIPADAIPAVMRGHQIVVAGDDRQLPPTNFFSRVSESDDEAAEDDESLVSFGVGFESVLDALRPLLPTAALAWHYRSRDERLVAFSNSRIYGGALTTFPGVFRGECLRHVVVAQGAGTGQEVSVTAEVNRVVELILEHARDYPRESLGVIALGIKHAERIDVALRVALARLEEDEAARLEPFFADDVPEPFFVKNLERVQGDERDAIIFTVGYGKHPDGRMRYQWGPLLRDGGERRLNVAATRAKHLLTLVSSFSGHDVDPERVTKAGARLLADYLDYASSGGTAPEATGAAELDSFEADVRDRLAARGITVVPRYGVGGYRVDFAATHPQDAGRMVLAIEQTAPLTASLPACATGTDCAVSICSAWAGAITGSGRRTGSGTRNPKLPGCRRPMTGPSPRSSRKPRSRALPRPPSGLRLATTSRARARSPSQAPGWPRCRVPTLPADANRNSGRATGSPQRCGREQVGGMHPSASSLTAAALGNPATRLNWRRGLSYDPDGRPSGRRASGLLNSEVRQFLGTSG